MSKETGKYFFEEAYKLGDKRIEVGLGWPIKGVSDEIKDFLIIIKKAIPTGKVLDLGCGEGRICIYFAQNDFEAYGIDFTKGAINRAKKFARETKVYSKINFQVGNVLDLSYPDNFFDVAVDYSVFDHILIKDWQLYVKNLLRVLKEGAFYILVVFSKNTEFIKNEKDKWYFSGDAYFHFFDKSDIDEIFGKYFKILKIIETKSELPPPFLFYNILIKRK